MCVWWGGCVCPFVTLNDTEESTPRGPGNETEGGEVHCHGDFEVVGVQQSVQSRSRL